MSTTTPPSSAEYLAESRGAGVALCFSICLVAIFLVLALRFWSRALVSGRKFWWDDWLALLCFPVYAALTGLCIAWWKIGLGKHVEAVDLADIFLGLKYLFAGTMLNNILITVPKISAIFFYARVFNNYNSRYFKWALWFVGGLSAAWGVYSIFSTAFQCSPPAKAWDPTIDGHCLNVAKWYLASILTNVIIDLMVLILPLPILFNLRMTLKRKLLLISVFVLGYGVVGVSIGRLVVILVLGDALNTDISWNAVPVFYFSALEPCISIICICLPANFHLFKRAKAHGFSSLFTTQQLPDDASDKQAVSWRKKASSSTGSGPVEKFSPPHHVRDRASESTLTEEIPNKAHDIEHSAASTV